MRVGETIFEIKDFYLDQQLKYRGTLSISAILCSKILSDIKEKG